VTYRHGWRVSKKVRRLYVRGRDAKPISMPVGWSASFFDSHLEALGQ
jgi:hypothetical protein